ncbi:hypothetical protein TWF718_006587 [Orbilia javanica]|uniref:C2H2-type domain-containing protein n=1 Tax=Orbilia javanica TaxID=47235 RepID=A0AAN8MN80_9PEZI
MSSRLIPERPFNGLSNSTSMACQAGSLSVVNRNSTVSNSLSVRKRRQLPPVLAIVSRIANAPMEKTQELVRSADILKYTYKEQSQIHAAVAERLKVESEKWVQEPPPLNCHICDKVMEDNARLKRHLLTHGPRNYRCNFPSCTWTFTFAKDLERHRKKHGIAIQVFKCGVEGCGRLMNRRDNARYHIRTVHGVEYGEANALVEVVPIDINMPDQRTEAAENNEATETSAPQGEIEAGPDHGAKKPSEPASVQIEDEEQNLKDMFSRFTTLDEGKESDDQNCGLDDWPTSQDVPALSQIQLGAQRGQSKKLKDRVMQVFYTTTRPRPPRLNRKSALSQPGNRLDAKASMEGFTNCNETTQTTDTKLPNTLVEGKSLFKGFLSLGAGRRNVDVGVAGAPAPSVTPKHPTRPPPPPPDLETSTPAPHSVPTIVLVPPPDHSQSTSSLGQPPSELESNIDNGGSARSRPTPNQLQVDPDFANKLRQTVQNKLQTDGI